MSSPTRFLTLKRAGLALLAVIGALGLYVGYSLFKTVNVVIPHSYAAWTTGDLLVEYLETHSNQWPHGWKDLSEARDSLAQKGRSVYWDFNKVTNIVKIDWEAKPEELAKAALLHGESSVKMVKQKDGSPLEAIWGADTEPNRKVARYLIQKYTAKNSAPKQDRID